MSNIVPSHEDTNHHICSSSGILPRANIPLNETPDFSCYGFANASSDNSDSSDDGLTREDISVQETTSNKPYIWSTNTDITDIIKFMKKLHIKNTVVGVKPNKQNREVNGAKNKIEVDPITEVGSRTDTDSDTNLLDNPTDLADMTYHVSVKSNQDKVETTSGTLKHIFDRKRKHKSKLHQYCSTSDNYDSSDNSITPELKSDVKLSQHNRGSPSSSPEDNRRPGERFHSEDITSGTRRRRRRHNQNIFSRVTVRLDGDREIMIYHHDLLYDVVRNVNWRKISPKRAGVIPYAVDQADGKLKFCLGVDETYGSLIDFGGQVEMRDSDAVEAGLREFHEESNAVFGIFESRQLQICRVAYRLDMIIMFLPLDGRYFSPDASRDVFVKNLSQHQDKELCDIIWLDVEKFKLLIKTGYILFEDQKLVPFDILQDFLVQLNSSHPNFIDDL